jgi:hypothetical protein
VSSTLARHRKPPRSAPPPAAAAGGRRRPSPVVSVLRSRLARVAAAAVVALALLGSAWPAAAHWMRRTPSLAWVARAETLSLRLAGVLGAQASQQQLEIVSVGVASGYLNPLRAVSGLVPERVDEGVDFAGSGPVYALGDAVVTNATAADFGWPGGGWITYQLTDGPDAGLMVYVAEDITPAVQVGQRVSSSTVIGDMFDGGDGIETGWAQPSGLSAESQLPEAGGIGGGGPFPTMVGLSFDALLQSLGVPAAPNRYQSGYGVLPPGYPASG